MSEPLPITEELDFAYLLELMPPLHNLPECAWLPELFSIIGHERLILLCKYAGGETIRIPTMEELCSSIEALQYLYDIRIKGTATINDVPSELQFTVKKMLEIYNVSNG